MDILALAIACLSFGLALGVFLLEWIRRFRKLDMYVSGVDISPYISGATVIFHETFLNPSIDYRVVCHVGKSNISGIRVLEFEKRHSENPDMIDCKLDSIPNVNFQMLKDELLTTPLDIPPLQSLTKRSPFYFAWDDTAERVYQLYPIVLRLSALRKNPDDKPYCEYTVRIPFQWLKDGGIYYFP